MVDEIQTSDMTSLVYLIYLEEKSQKEAVEYIYNKKYGEFSFRKYKEARETLVKNNYIESDGSLRNVKYESNVKPIVDYIEDNIEQKTDSGLSKEEIEGLEKFLDSSWFRSLFTISKFENLYHVNRVDGKLELNSYDGALTVISQVLDLITYTGKIFNSETYYDEFVNHSSIEKFFKKCEWKTEESPSDILDAVDEELPYFVDENELEWEQFYWEKVVEKEIINCVPQLPVPLRKYPSQVMSIKDQVFRNT